MLPLNAFNKLRSGIDWVLEKLGVINKESDTLDQTAARTQAATYGSGGYIPATSSYAGYQAYQPVTAPAYALMWTRVKRISHQPDGWYCAGDTA